jgi:hypothetical protein
VEKKKKQEMMTTTRICSKPFELLVCLLAEFIGLVYHHCRLLVQLRGLSPGPRLFLELAGSTSKHSSRRQLDALPFVIVIVIVIDASTLFAGGL